MSDLFDQAGKALDSLSNRQRYDERNRLTLLVIHGLIGVVVFWLIVHDGPPAAWTDRFNDPNGWRLGAPGLVGGALLLCGLAFGRRLVLELAGMTVMLLWDLGLAVLFAWQVANVESAVSYPIGIYLGLAALMGVHLWTLVAYIWKGRA